MATMALETEDLENELRFIRHELDSLDTMRMSGPLEPAERERYAELCREESAVVAALAMRSAARL